MRNTSAPRRSALWKIYGKMFTEPLRVIVRDPLALAGLVILTFIVLVALFAPWIAPYDPDEMHRKVEGVLFRLSDGEARRLAAEWPFPLNAVTMRGDEIIAVGGGGRIVRFEGGRWVEEATSTESELFAVASGERTYAAGDGVILRKDEGEWRSDLVREGTAFKGLSLAGNSGLAVGEDGAVLKLSASGAWEEVPHRERGKMASASLANENLGFIVGERGMLLRYERGSLRREMVRAFRDLNDVHAYTPDFALAVGARGTILHFDGTRWREMFGPETRDLRAVRIVNEKLAFAVGPFGVVLKYDGTNWTSVETGYRRNFRGLGSADGAVLAVGSDPFINELSPPTRDHLFGTTHLGRDIFTQTVYGSRTALLVAILASLVVSFIGVNVGLVAGYFRGKTDDILMRIVDIMYALPFEPFAMILVLIFNPSIWIVILAVGLLTWRTNARVVRSQVLSIARRPFVKAARAAGASDFRIMFVHIAPNILPLVFLQLAVAAGFAITAEATLSFLGLGPPRMHSWGTILHAARLSGAWRTAWWWIIPPGALIMLTVVSIFFIARALEVLSNPRLKNER
jgi:ABC-type dipeptide/oligopeptide/nickel transport system permease subunit